MILSIDGGFGIDKYAFFGANGEISFGKYISTYSKAPDDASDMPLFEGLRYYIGEEALMEDSNNIINVIDYKSHEKFSPLAIYNILNLLNIDSEDVSKLVVGLSLAQKDYIKNYVKRISKFKVSKEIYDFNNRISLLPQGVSAKYAIDHYYFKESHDETYAIVDIGQLTVDVVHVISGNVRPENAEGLSHEGIIKIIQKIQEYIASKFKEFISIKEAQEVLLTNKFILFGEHDLSNEINEFKKEYTSYLVSILNQRYKNIFKKYPKIFFVGGGRYYINKDYIESKTGHSNIILPDHSEFYNAIGGLLYEKRKS